MKRACSLSGCRDNVRHRRSLPHGTFLLSGKKSLLSLGLIMAMETGFLQYTMELLKKEYQVKFSAPFHTWSARNAGGGFPLYTGQSIYCRYSRYTPVDGQQPDTPVW